MEICILEKVCVENSSTLLSDANQGTVFTIKHACADANNFRVSVGNGNLLVGCYRVMLMAASGRSTSDIILRLKTDTAARSNKVDVAVEGFFTERTNSNLWLLGGAPVKLRVTLGMTKLIMKEGKVQILERGFINTAEMTPKRPRVTGLDFPTSILETHSYSDGSSRTQHPTESGTMNPAVSLSGTLALSLICDFKFGRHIRIETDVDIFCDGQILKCHKAVLAAQSPVFMKMFRHDGQTNKIKIEDVPMNAIVALRGFLYEGFMNVEIDVDPKLAVDVLQASQKFEVVALEGKIKDHILFKPASWMNLESALQLYLISRNLASCSALKAKAVKVMKEKSGEIPNSEGFKTLFKDKENVEIALELCALGFSS